MTEKGVKSHIVVSTDIGGGDDYGAVMACCAFAAIYQYQLSFVATYGDRETKKHSRKSKNGSSENLALVVPRLWEQLGQSKETLPGIYEGADRPLYARSPFRLKDDSIEWVIHDEFPKRSEDKPAKIKPSEELIKTLKESHIPVALLSIGAATETAKLTKSLGSLIQISVAMLGEMGTQGNVEYSREANASRDPKANIRLLKESNRAKIPFTLVSLESTEKKGFLVDNEMIDYLSKQLGKKSYAFRELMFVFGPKSAYGKFYSGSTKDKNTFPYRADINYGGAVPHDLVAAAILIDLILNKKRHLVNYSKNVRVGANPLGNIQKVKEYMSHFFIDVAGPRTKYFWPFIVELLKQYQ